MANFTGQKRKYVFKADQPKRPVGRPPKNPAVTVARTLEEKRDDVQAAARKRAAALLAGVDPEDVPSLAHETNEPPEMDLGEIMAGVGLTWLTRVFRMDRNTTKIKLAGCPAIRVGSGSQKLYDIAQAAAYLVKPKMDLPEILENMKPADLPTHLQPAIWGAKLKHQEWAANAGQLWLTQDVLAVLTETFTILRTSIQLWVDALEKSGLTEQHRLMLNDLTDKLQEDLYKELCEMPKNKRTRSQLKEIDSEEVSSNEVSSE